MKFQSGIAYLDRLAAWDGKTKFTLEANLKLLRALGSPQNKIPSVHVAGTNGKGTVCAQLAAMLHAGGRRVGQYLSPHLGEVNERCLVDGCPVTLDDLAHASGKVESAAQDLKLQPSFFEAITATAFLLFAEAEVDWMVVEVGLGGRLDATNAIEHPHAAVITSIALDHTQILGPTLGDIAREKAGIFKAGTPAFVGRVPSEAQIQIEKAAKKAGCSVEFLGSEFVLDLEHCRLESKDGLFQFDEQEFPRRAAHDQHNTALAVRVGQHLGLSCDEIHRGLETYRWPGRLEEIRTAKGARILLDIAHNPDGIAALLDHLRKAEQSLARLVFFVSILDHKDWRAMLQLMKREATSLAPSIEWVFTASDHEAAVKPSALADEFGEGRLADDSCAAFREAAAAAGEGTLIVVTGSLFIVGKLRPEIVSEPFRTIIEK